MLRTMLNERVTTVQAKIAEELIRVVIEQTSKAVLAYTTVSVQLDISDALYGHVSEWMLNKHTIKPTHVQGLGNLAAQGAFNQALNHYGEPELNTVLPEKTTKLNGTPATGVYLVWHNGVPLVLQYVVEFARSARHTVATPSRSLRLWSYRGHLDTIISFLREVQHAVTYDENRTVTLFTSSSGGYWERIHSARRRPIDSVVLPAGQREALQEDIQRFRSDEDWYYHNAVPFRRGYLLHGLAGTGKSSLIVALAGEYNFRLYILNLADPELDDTKLQELTASVGDDAAILLEDVDTLAVDRDRTDSKLSFSAVLNAIDGVTASQNRILFMTTNRIEVLDHALIRPGRIDYRLEFTTLTEDQAYALITRFYPELDAETLAQHPKINRMVASELQKLLIDCRNSPKKLHTLLDRYVPVVDQ